MSNLLARSLCAVLLISAAAFARAGVLDFEDRPAGAAFFVADYHGFTIGTNDVQTTAWFSSDDTSFYTAHSGSHYIITDASLYSGADLEATQSISSATAFVFDGAWFSGVDHIAYDLFLNGVNVFSSSPSAELTLDASTFIASGYAGLVDSVVIRGNQGGYALDDFTYHVGVSAVPEPGSVALLGIGALGCLVAACRRRSVG